MGHYNIPPGMYQYNIAVTTKQIVTVWGQSKLTRNIYQVEWLIIVLF